MEILNQIGAYHPCDQISSTHVLFNAWKATKKNKGAARIDEVDI